MNRRQMVRAIDACVRLGWMERLPDGPHGKPRFRVTEAGKAHLAERSRRGAVPTEGCA